MKNIKRILKILRNAWVLLPIVGFKYISHFFYFGQKAIDQNNPDLFSVKVKTCGNISVYLRQKSAVDRDVFRYVFYNQYHLPPVNLPNNAVILDLGTNIGLTVCHYKYLYPDAKIIGYEMDKPNFEMAQKNCKNLDNNTIINAAVWKETGVITYQTDTEEDAYHISNTPASNNKTMVSADAISISEILATQGIDKVHFIKMDIEGAEKDILRHPDRGWMKQVGSINMEVHDTEFFQEAIQIFESEGFVCQKDHRHWSAILAVRPSFFS